MSALFTAPQRSCLKQEVWCGEGFSFDFVSEISFCLLHSATVAVGVHEIFQIAAVFIENKATRLEGKKQTEWMFATKELSWFVFKADQCSQIGLISAIFLIQNIALLIMARFLFTNRNSSYKQNLFGLI